MTMLDTEALTMALVTELERRRVSAAAFRYANQRGGPEALYGLTGAVHIHAALGLPLGDRATRAEVAARILAHRDETGCFVRREGPGHALHMAVGALNLLGEAIPADIGPLAPRDPAALVGWLDRLDWRSTHKELGGQTIPLLASGGLPPAWIDLLAANLAGRLSPDRPAETWCAAGDPPWRVISCLYHVLAVFDHGRLPYPYPDRLIDRLLGLCWEEAPDSVQRTVCTDGDWALMLLRLIEHRPACATFALAAIRAVSRRRVRAWQETPETVLDASTHDLFCYLWVTAVFQSCVRDHYRGRFLRDTLNDPALYRL